MELDGGSMKEAVQTVARSSFSPFLAWRSAWRNHCSQCNHSVYLQAEHKTQFCINFILQQ